MDYPSTQIPSFPKQTRFQELPRYEKNDLIQALKDSNNLTKSESEKTVTLFFDMMAEALTQEDRVEIRGLFSIFVKE